MTGAALRVRIAVLLWVVLLVAGGPADAQWQPDTDDKLQVKAAKAIDAVRERVPAATRYFDDAYGFAVLPSVTRIGLGFGGATGKGLVLEGDALAGTTRFWQFTSGIQGGARNFSMIVFFKDKESLEYFKTGKLQFMGQAGIAVGTVGIAGTPAYNDGVAIVTVTRLGLMFEFTISGGKFSYRPLATN
jgi:lipid-binding SYLF domain-containing protein